MLHSILAVFPRGGGFASRYALNMIPSTMFSPDVICLTRTMDLDQRALQVNVAVKTLSSGRFAENGWIFGQGLTQSPLRSQRRHIYEEA